MVPHITETTLTNIYRIHYADEAKGLYPAYGKSAFYEGKTPSMLQKILQHGLTDNTNAWELNSDGYFQRTFTYHSSVGWNSLQAVGTRLLAPDTTAGVLVAVDRFTGDVITMYPNPR